jgi:phosphoglycolate phosphatase-like HAD superfamily hydrolase
MAFEARNRLGLDLGASLMVGDMETDRLFARNAGIGTFAWAHEFFRGMPTLTADAAAGSDR